MKLRNLLVATGLLASASAASAADGAVSPHAYEIGEIFGIAITNSMVTSWVISLILILVIRLMVGKISLVPSKGQVVIETLVIGVRDLISPIVGKRMVGPTFWLLGGLFTFILISNWSGLLPGVGTIGHDTVQIHFDSVEQQNAFNSLPEGSEEREDMIKELRKEGQVHDHFRYVIRPANADLNMTFALAAVSMVAWLYYIFVYVGPRGVVKDIFGNKADKENVPMPVYYLLTIIFIGVGFIEIISILFRPVSLSFRLFGNMFGGENLLTSMHGIFAFLLPIPFYFLEVIIGFVQALVFTLLVAVYIGLICNHGDEEHGH
ncbi:F0F1 ATP synthase subunit A [Puniceicoccus vermicola]|uniref:ATP synthase subunit a n=1 Tax=Puniceicoccus vermicola TaxID=388746 RepID=A0A7X1E2V1_9BACT|nr:F0F1 ATP synthase subunit A [Puniceicoccus vermicola]MBC2600273.1 F0F1 ATP synthase subunit A [Puniceicoccus vermicola]